MTSGLETLKKRFVLDSKPDDDLDNISSVSNLKQYLQELKNDDIDTPQLLQHIKIRETNSIKDDSSGTSLSDTELDILKEEFINYQNEIKQLRSKIEPVLEVIKSFDNQLNTLAVNLLSLNEQSNDLSKNLYAKREATEKLNPIILDLMIPPDVVQSIIKEPINEKWLENIRFLNEKIYLIECVKTDRSKLKNAYHDSVAFKELESGVDLLVAKAVERIRDFMIGEIKKLRSSTKESSQKIQLRLLKVKEIYSFMERHHSILAKQLQVAYIYTMRWYYQTKFAKYLYALQKLKIRHVDLSFVLGSNTIDDKLNLLGLKGWLYSGSSGKGSLAVPSQNNPQGQQHSLTLSEYFQSFDSREKILEDDSNSTNAIPSQIAETTPFAYWIEFIYHQWSIALIDNIVVEYLFMVDFFYLGEEKFQTIDRLLNTPSIDVKKDWANIMFEGIFKIGSLFVSWLINSNSYQVANTASSQTSRLMTQGVGGSYDGYGILLIIRLVQKAQYSLHNRFHIPVLDDYLNSLLLILWPQFTKVIDINCESMKKSIYYSSSEATFSTVSLTQQFSRFLLSLLKLATTADKDKDYRSEPLFTSITRLNNDFEVALNKLSKRLFKGKKNGETEMFLYSNYLLVVNILQSENQPSTSPLVQEQIDHFETLCNAYNIK